MKKSINLIEHSIKIKENLTKINETSIKINEKPLWRSSAVQWGEGSRLQFPKHFEQHVGDIAELELNENPLGEEKFHQLKCLQPGHPWRSSEFHVGSTSSRSFLLWCCFIYIVNRWSWSSRERFPLWRVPVQKPTKTMNNQQFSIKTLSLIHISEPTRPY